MSWSTERATNYPDHPALLEMLLDAGSDPVAETSGGTTPLGTAASVWSPAADAVTQLLRSHALRDTPHSPLHPWGLSG